MAIPSIRAEIKRLLIVALWVLFSAGYFNRFPLPGFLSYIYLLLVAGLVAVSAWGYGTFLLHRLIPDIPDRTESFVFAAIAGFGILSLVMVLGGVIGLWTRGSALILVSIGLLLGWRHRLTRHSPLPPAGNPSRPDLAFIPFFLISAGAILSLLIAFSPITYYDSLVYHLALPQSYLHAGHWIGQEDLIYSAFPQNMEMIWLLGMLLAGDILANLLGWLIAVVGVLAVYCFAKRFLGNRTAIWAAAFLCVMPAYLLLSSGGYVDVGLTVFSFLSFYAICQWKETPRSEFLVLAGAMAGWAMGTKYTGAIPFGIGGGIILFGSTPKIRNLLIYAGSALLVFSPWLIKNLHYVGNPVFPFFYSFSLKPASPWLGAAAEGYFHGLTEYAPRSGWHLLRLLWDMTVHGLDFGGGMDVLGDLGWAPLFAFLPAVWLVRQKNKTLPLLLLYSLCFFIPWGMSRPVLRFLLPLAPFLALAAAYGYDQGIGPQPTGIRRVSQVFLALLIVSNVRQFFEVSDLLALSRVPLGFESREDYLSRNLDYYPAAEFINTLPENTLTYIVGDQRSFYYNRPVLVTPVFNTNPLTGWANDAASAEDLAIHLKEQHITHLLINDSEMKRLNSVYQLFPFTSKGEKNWELLRSHVGRGVYRDKACEVLSL